ncbi:PIG-L deacetylase family protein [Cryobacterium fucosi]|uniref:PIG-L family deacetylase n=1 Tax=Cryobacterium fucosi TaxID=1259157 RepID=A0A4R9B767_9MICO|nr:PIG-L deacetylase family protein [Cryobacterium fucosi]TFD76927.1 PIG-L family deacetylase [Cryobacterium fucosi]
MTANLLPAWRRVLVVVAHPDDESFGLGAVLASFVGSGCEVSVLCLTRGEASTLHGVAGDLAKIRGAELAGAARELGIGRVELRDYPDGQLYDVPLTVLIDEIATFAAGQRGDGILVFDPSGVTGHPDHRRATEAALAFAQIHGSPVLGWTLPSAVALALQTEYGAPFLGHAPADIDMVVSVDRATQKKAVACHPSQAVPGHVLWRRLELLGPHEHLRWLHGDESQAVRDNDPALDRAHNHQERIS